MESKIAMYCLRMICRITVCVYSLTNPMVRDSGTNAADREATTNPPSSPDWLRGKFDLLRPAWGLRGGLVYSIHPGGVESTSRQAIRSGVPSHGTAAITPLSITNEQAPRGLIRLYFPVLDGGRYDLVNFIAVEPVVAARRGFSELELSRLDGVPGKRIWSPGDVQPRTPVEPGKLRRPMPGVEMLEVVLRVERFDNGAHIYLVVTQRSDAPDEIQLTIHREPDSAPLQYCVLTATMGNKAPRGSSGSTERSSAAVDCTRTIMSSASPPNVFSLSRGFFAPRWRT